MVLLNQVYPLTPGLRPLGMFSPYVSPYGSPFGNYGMFGPTSMFGDDSTDTFNLFSNLYSGYPYMRYGRGPYSSPLPSGPLPGLIPLVSPGGESPSGVNPAPSGTFSHITLIARLDGQSNGNQNGSSNNNGFIPLINPNASTTSGSALPPGTIPLVAAGGGASGGASNSNLPIWQRLSWTAGDGCYRETGNNGAQFHALPDGGVVECDNSGTPITIHTLDRNNNAPVRTPYSETNHAALVRLAKLMSSLGGLKSELNGRNLIFKPQQGNERYNLIAHDGRIGFYRTDGGNNEIIFLKDDGTQEVITPAAAHAEDIRVSGDLSFLGLVPSTTTLQQWDGYRDHPNASVRGATIVNAPASLTYPLTGGTERTRLILMSESTVDGNRLPSHYVLSHNLQERYFVHNPPRSGGSTNWNGWFLINYGGGLRGRLNGTPSLPIRYDFAAQRWAPG